MNYLIFFLCLIIWGVLTEITSPGHSFYLLSFIMFLPFFYILRKYKERWLHITLLFGLIYNLIYFRWLIYPFQYTNLPLLISILILCLMALVLTIFLIIFAYFYVKVFKFKNIIGTAALFTTLEILKSFIFTGFPWGDLSYNFAFNPSLIQVASILGSYSITFIIILINLLIFDLINYKNFKSLILAFIVLISFFLINNILLEKKFTGLKKNILIVQGNIPEQMKLKEENAEKILQVYMNLTEKYLSKKEKVDLIIWPESIYIKFFEQDEELFEKFKLYLAKIKKPLIFGAPSIDINDQDKYFVYNSFYIFNNTSKLLRYDKIHLVPFGEYTPLKKIFFFVNKIVPGVDFSKGSGIKILKFKDFKIIPLICFEGIFPWQILKANKLNGNCLVNISNEAWFGNSFALYQHLAANILRTVESRKFFIRCANTGITTIIAPTGKIIKKLPPYEKSCIIGSIKLIDKLSIYHNLGFLFNFFYFFIFNLELILSRFRQTSK